ncbi:MAG: hypothetical protein ABFS10_11665 [Bacteroidota bacterium]
MRNLLFLLPVILSLSACSGEITDLDRSGLKGEVKRITEHQYEAFHKDDRWTAGKPVMFGHRIMNYDKDGLYMKSFVLSEGGDTIGYTTCRHEGGDLVEETFHSADGRTARTILERVSDEQVNFEMWEGERLHYEGANYYDSKGRTEKQARVVNGVEEFSYYVYEKDLMVESYQENGSGVRSGTQIFEYTEFDDKGNWTTRLIYLTKDKIVPEMLTKREYEYY